MATAIKYEVSLRHYDDLFFHPSVCHVCKFLSDKDMIRCNCGMLSYCSQEHMAIDRKGSDANVGHGEICDIIKTLVRRGWMRIFPGGEHHKWIEQKYKYMEIVEEKLSRKMMPHEQRMLLFIRYCLVCHKDAQLKFCKKCYSVDYCNEHYRKVRRKETQDHPCHRLKQWLYFEIKATNIYPIPQWRTFHNFPNKGDVDDILAFFNKYAPHVRQEDSNWLDLIYSDYLSWPLTVYDVMRKMKLLNYARTKNTYVIHIVEASYIDKLYLPSWEVFLHVFRRPMKLIVVMIGTDLTSDVAGTSGKLQICLESCIPLGHELYFQYHGMSYQEYVAGGLYQEPDMIIGFQVNYHDSDTVSQFLIASFQFPYCPIILTAKSQFYAEKLINKVKSVIKGIDKHKLPLVELNKFKSYRPYRDHIDGRIYYRNEHMIIFYKLDF